ncbi:hypothetical protein LQZ19_06525 [Treponema primitia]|uniref:hypothetical protein n=1 Tax=Treponema primitia TaxID=88058 RepID=UPI00397FF031
MKGSSVKQLLTNRRRWGRVSPAAGYLEFPASVDPRSGAAEADSTSIPQRGSPSPTGVFSNDRETCCAVFTCPIGCTSLS